MKTELELQFEPLLNECDKLRILILDPQPGLATWHSLIRDRLEGMRDELAKLLPDGNEMWEVVRSEDGVVFASGYETKAEAMEFSRDLNNDPKIPHSFFVRAEGKAVQS